MSTLGAVQYLAAIPGVWHEFAELFPMLDAASAARLAEDIAEHGVREPIVQFEGRVLDGRNRYMAARDKGISVPVVQFEGTRQEALAFVLSTNLHRRHLTESQRAAVAAKLANMRLGDNQHIRGGSANLPTLSPQVSQAQAAEMLNVSERSVRTAKAVLEQGAPELVAAVEAGEVSVSAAAAVSELPSEEQVTVVAQGPKAVTAKAKEVRTQKAVQPPAVAVDSEAEPTGVAPEEAKERRALAKLTTEALIDEVIGLRAALAEAKAKARTQKAEIEQMKEDIAAFRQSDRGQALGNAQRLSRAAEGRMKEFQATAVRLDRRVKLLEDEKKRLKAELEKQEVEL